MQESEMNLFLVGRKVTPGKSGRPYDVELVMMEGEAKEVAEDIIVDAIKFGLEAVRPVIDLQDKMRAAIGKAKRPVEEAAPDEELVARVRAEALPGLKEGYSLPRKLERYSKLGDVRAAVIKSIGGGDAALSKKVAAIIEHLESRILRDMILQEKKRIDGRSSTDIRPISSEVGILPRAHGSALFNRGETQALAVLTLGTSSDEQRMDYIAGEERRSFMLHYNFPPYSVGEAKSLRSPGQKRNRPRRAGAQGAESLSCRLLKRFPTPSVLFRRFLSSNGSSSMATVCGGILCLMDGGVPVKDIVAGIAMGLLKEGEEVVILSDILGDEDHAGDMDFKVCGTEKGVTAMQMDIKIDGLTEDILRKALAQAREGRIHIIGKIRETMTASRSDISLYAPRITTVKVKEDQVRTVIGSGGKNIRQIISETGVTIDVEDDGTVTIASSRCRSGRPRRRDGEMADRRSGSWKDLPRHREENR